MKTDLNVNVESKTVEKGIDAAKGFLSKLLSPGLNEVGLLIKDQVAAIRFRNQIKLLNKTNQYCVQNKISPKVIPLKLLYPLLEAASLEEDEEILDKWAILLSNLVDSEQNIQNHVFPFLLGQISKKEFEILETAAIEKKERLKGATKQLNQWLATDEDKLEELKKTRQKLSYRDAEFSLLMNQIAKLEQNYKSIISEISKPQKLNEFDLEDFEFSNLLRLGLVTSVPLQYGYVHQHSARVDTYSDSVDLSDVDVKIENDGNEYWLSDLGQIFIEACIEKKRK